MLCIVVASSDRRLDGRAIDRRLSRNNGSPAGVRFESMTVAAAETKTGSVTP
jgi:hypothetical protein